MLLYNKIKQTAFYSISEFDYKMSSRDYSPGTEQLTSINAAAISSSSLAEPRNEISPAKALPVKFTGRTFENYIHESMKIKIYTRQRLHEIVIFWWNFHDTMPRFIWWKNSYALLASTSFSPRFLSSSYPVIVEIYSNDELIYGSTFPRLLLSEHVKQWDLFLR